MEKFIIRVMLITLKPLPLFLHSSRGMVMPPPHPIPSFLDSSGVMLMALKPLPLFLHSSRGMVVPPPILSLPSSPLLGWCYYGHQIPLPPLFLGMCKYSVYGPPSPPFLPPLLNKKQRHTELNSISSNYMRKRNLK